MPRRSSVPPSAQAAWPEQTTIPDILKGSGEVRIAGFGGTMNEAQIKAYYEPFEKISGIKVRAFPGSNPTKVKAMVETGNVEWDMAQLSRGSIMNLQKSGDYFEKIDYDIIDPGVDPAYRFEYGLEMLVWAQVLAYRTDRLQGRSAEGLGRLLGHQEVPRRPRHDRHQRRQLARARIRPDGGGRAGRQALSARHRQGLRELRQDQEGASSSGGTPAPCPSSS